MKHTACYHLPGLFEFYELYRLFLPLFREHRNIFMTGARSAPSMARRRTASGAGAALALAMHSRTGCLH